MTKQEIKEQLCYYDLRNPDGVSYTHRSYGLLDASTYWGKEEIKEEGYGNHKKEDCSCDNCSYGRTNMAEELLKYVSNGTQRELLNGFAEWLKNDDDHNLIGKYTVDAYLESI
tara:strand:+ start:108 stop:446 length:339 start_codon:yes stop_codon:yes gene_type:complete